MNSSSKNVEQEREEAREIVRWLEPMLQELQVEYAPLDWHGSGVLAPLAVNGVEVDDLARVPLLKESVLDSIRRGMMVHIALAHLGLTRGNHIIHFTPALPEPGTTATWVIHIDDSPGVAVAECLREGRRGWELYAIENIHEEEGEEEA